MDFVAERPEQDLGQAGFVLHEEYPVAVRHTHSAVADSLPEIPGPEKGLVVGLGSVSCYSESCRGQVTAADAGSSDEGLDSESGYAWAGPLTMNHANVGSSDEDSDWAPGYVLAGPLTERPATAVIACVLPGALAASLDRLEAPRVEVPLGVVAVAAQVAWMSAESRSETCHPYLCLVCPGLNQRGQPPWPC